MLNQALLSMGGSRFWSAAAAGLGYGVGHHTLNYQEGKLKAWYGEDRYQQSYAQGMDAAHGTVTAAALFGGASALLGKKVLGMPMPLGVGTAMDSARMFGRMVGGRTPSTGKTTSAIRKVLGMRKRLNPMNWANGTLMTAGIGAVGVGATAGYFHGKSRAQNPMLEAGNISLATPATRRLNYSTVGLTQALHDRARRTY